MADAVCAQCRGAAPAPTDALVPKLGGLISVKGEDILLSTHSSQLVKFHRCPQSCGNGGSSLAGLGKVIRSISIRSRCAPSLPPSSGEYSTSVVGARFLHLVDSLVVLHALARGRSSSRKLRSTLSRINALLLCSSKQALWGYVSTEQNPSDRPSRWGSRVRTKVRHA